MSSTRDEVVRTSDGVDLSLRRTDGAGPPLVLAHGGATDRSCFDPLLPLLEGRSVVAYDRRGHGRSTGSATPDLAREAQDLVEVVAHVGGPVLLLGYSYGALVALRALTTTDVPIVSAVLYEPPMAVEELLAGLDEVVALVRSGDHEAAAALFVSSTFHVPDAVVEAMRRHPAWQVSVGLVPTLPAELEALRTAVLPEPPLAAPPVRLLVAEQGGNPAFRRIVDHLAAVLPDAEVVGVPGLPHFAMATEPAAFVRAALEHLDRDRRQQGQPDEV